MQNNVIYNYEDCKGVTIYKTYINAKV